MKITTELPQMTYPIPRSLDELFAISASFAGFHAVSSYLACAERSRLRASGLRRKQDEKMPGEKMNALEFGIVMHALLAIRIIHGMQTAQALVGSFLDERTGLGFALEDRPMIMALLKLYDLTYPLNAEPFEYLGVETEVISDVGVAWLPTHDSIRTVRYDAVVRPFGEKVVYSLETKTSARAGETSMNSYMPQFATQACIWNSNPALVERWGKMIGVIPNMLVKTKKPSCERMAPRLISARQQELARRYLLAPSRVHLPINPDGTHLQMIHNCWGRFGACEYVDFCWEGVTGDYTTAEQRATS